MKKNYHHNMPYSWHTKAAITMAYSAVLMRENSYCHASFAILMQITTLCHAHDAQQLPPQWQTVPCPWQNKHDLHSDLLCHAHDNKKVPLQWHTFVMLMTTKSSPYRDLLCHAHDGKSHSAFLASGQTGHRTQGKVSADPKTAQLCSVHLCRFPWNNHHIKICTYSTLSQPWSEWSFIFILILDNITLHSISSVQFKTMNVLQKAYMH